MINNCVDCFTLGVELTNNKMSSKHLKFSYSTCIKINTKYCVCESNDFLVLFLIIFFICSFQVSVTAVLCSHLCSS